MSVAQDVGHCPHQPARGENGHALTLGPENLVTLAKADPVVVEEVPEQAADGRCCPWAVR